MDIIGKEFLVEFRMAKAILKINSETSLTFTITEKEGQPQNIVETVAITLTQLRPRLFVLTWKEQNGNTVTQIQDHKEGFVYNNWTTPAGELISERGTLKPQD